MTRQQAHRILDHACDMCGVEDKFGSHGMRKSWGYFAFKQGVSLDYISIALNHRSIAETKDIWVYCKKIWMIFISK
ncbi:tyrosine-type recombinase/integrase [Paenibacillus sp. JTLBN-2024]